MFEFLKGLPASVPVAIVGDSGPLTLDAPPTVAVVNADGLSVASGATTGTAGAYTFSMPSQTRLGPYAVTITGMLGGQAVTSSFPIECVGSFLFSVVDLRAFDDAIDSRYTDATVKTARGFVQDEFRRISGRRFTPRAAVETVTVSNGAFYVDNVDVTRLVGVKVAGVAADITSVTLSPIGVGYGLADGTAVVEYEYGALSVPADIRRAAMLRASTVLYSSDSGIPDRATSYNVDGAQYALATAGRSGFETGLPEVDAILARYRMRPPGVA